LSNGASAAAVTFATAAAQLNKELFKMTFLRPVQLDAFYINKTGSANLLGNVTNSIKIQGSNDNTVWTDLTAAITSPLNATNNIPVGFTTALANSNKFTIAQNAAKYKYYRIYGVAAATTLGGVASEIYYDVNANYDGSMFQLPICESDADGDGKYNYLDLDSDADGCSDALEAGATTSTTANFQFTGTAASFGTNGLINTLETVADNSIINYTSTHVNAVSNNIAYCSDTDQDGINDTDDIDDDNDGVLDAVESPGCFFTPAEWNSTIKTPFVSISSDLNLLAPNTNFSALTDGIDNFTPAIQFVSTPAQSQLSKELLKFSFVSPLPIDAIYIQKRDGTQLFGGNVMVQGSNDNTTWSNLMAAAANQLTLLMLP
jgi:hypothetical protein